MYISIFVCLGGLAHENTNLTQEYNRFEQSQRPKG